jgi:hypothetical protein
LCEYSKEQELQGEEETETYVQYYVNVQEGEIKVKPETGETSSLRDRRKNSTPGGQGRSRKGERR